MNCFLFALVVCSVVCSAQGSFVGQWTDTDEGGYGLSTYVCVSGNQLFGFYSQVGVMRGSVSGNTATGKWYEPGSGLYENNQTLPSTGTFSLTLADDGQSWSGTYSYPGVSLSLPWNANRIDNLVPSNSQCWFAAEEVDSMAGNWRFGETFWYLCDADGGDDLYFSTYSYTDNNVVVGTGFSQGLVQDGIYRGEWTQAGFQAGVELFGLFGTNGLRSSWWQGQAMMDAPLFVSNTFSHNIDDYTLTDGDVTEKQCASYFSIDTSAASNVLPWSTLFFAVCATFFLFN